MADSFQNEVPKASINLKPGLHTGGASKKTGLPLKLLVAGDFSNRQESTPLSERKNLYCARAMEGTASLCQARAHAEILPEHWLLKLLKQA